MTKNYIDSSESRKLVVLLEFNNLHLKNDHVWGMVQNYLNIRKIARGLNSLDTKYCNGDIATGAAERKTERLYGQIEELLKDTGIYWYHQQDPRGTSLYLSREPFSDGNYSHALAII